MPKDLETLSDYLNSKAEVARKLKASGRTVDRIIQAGELPFVQLSPRRIGVLQSDLEAFWLSRRRWRPAPPAAEAN
jgi:hypothetical protein